ncbi:hypothetical protein FGF1_14900 [Flavobacteriaceae bacterium GF1]
MLFASNNGPNAPEAAGFEPVDATDMVNLSTGDLSYVMPLLDMDGFPVTLSYHAGVPLDMESSWIGLGWNINTGAVNRGISGTPDDWKNANSLDFIHYSDSQEFYSINVGVGISEAAEVGVGLSWGSNKSLTGSVYASLAFVSASIDTDGNYGVGVGISKQGSNFGGSLSVSGNVNQSGLNVGVGVGAATNTGAFASLGYGFGSNSFSIGAGLSNRQSLDKRQAGSASLSLSNYSAGDYDISSKGFYVPINLGVLNFGFGKRKITYKLDKAYPRNGYGILYARDADVTSTNNDIQNDRFKDLQNRYVYGDAYEEAIPVFQDEFVADYKNNREKVNFSFASYDSYEVNAPGISGIVQPKVLQNAILLGMGYYGSDSDDSNKKMRVYYHHGNGITTTKTFGTSTSNSSSDIKFYFNGQFTEDFGILSRSLAYFSGANSFDDMLALQQPNNGYENNINQRQKSGNYVEVFTNQQLATGSTTQIMYPETFQQSNYGSLPADGIGAYKITAPDGKTYHYSLPVYHYERIERTVLKDNNENHVNEKRQYTPFATHWLLTAVTGPDFVDFNNNNIPDKDDYGYWVRLDHGQWSDGFVWRSPYQGKNYDTNLVGDIEEKDFGNYQLGRKQLYYLDKIVTKTQTAYFVKDVRYDATGAYGDNNGTLTSSTTRYEYEFNGPSNVQNAVGQGQTYVGDRNFYKRSFQLKLDHILLVNDSDGNVGKTGTATADLDEYNCLPGYSKSTSSNPGYDLGGGFWSEYGTSSYSVFREYNVYDVLDFSSFDYNKAIKVIQFDQDYSLAPGTPSSIACTANPTAGRLTLKSVQFQGKNKAAYIPPFEFAYKNEMGYPNVPNSEKTQTSQLTVDYAKDPWGFIDEKYVAALNNSTDHVKYGPDNWSLTQIKTPTGGTITMEYEEDDYYIEAFSRKFWQDNLQIAVTTDNNSVPGSYMYFHIKNMNGLRDDIEVDFKNYFSVGERVYFDLWLVRTYDPGLFSEDFLGGVDMPGQYPYAIVVDEITSDNTLVLKVYRDPFNNPQVCPSPGSSTRCDLEAVIDYAWNGTSPLKYFAKKNGVGSNIYVSLPRGKYINSVGDGANRHTMTYKLLANKVDRDLTGGGLRVKSITLENEFADKYKTAYHYNKPGTNEDPDHPDYVSSGITSFAPERSLKFVPYQPELPSPGVMYEHVTMEPFADDGSSMGKTAYEFYVLQPIFDIFDPNIEMFDVDNTSIFKSEVFDPGYGGIWIPNADVKAYAKEVDLKVNTSLIGQFKSISNYNRFGHLVSKTTNNYLSGEAAKNIDGRGAVRESFQTMKSVFTTNSNDDNPVLKKRLISVSSKEEYSSVLKSVETVSGGFTSMEEYFDADPETGAFRTTETTRADGTRVRVTKVPAYDKYPDMGSKVVNENNHHMLVQEAMNYTLLDNSGTWVPIDANITTWNDRWNYRNYSGAILYWNDDLSPEERIWRKHENYVWEGDLDANGQFLNYNLTNDDGFNWSIGASQSTTDWKKISTTALYDRNSHPLEVADINDNKASTKMGNRDSWVFSTSTASYTEAYYSGAEYIHYRNVGYFDGEIRSSGQSTEKAHTGSYSVKATAGLQGFRVFTDHTARPGKYKVSVWVNNTNKSNARVNVGNGNESFNGEEIIAGHWTQMNHYFDLNGQQPVYVTSASGTVYFDDFRMHPVWASMNSYVYDEDGRLSFLLGPNNMGTHYSYDTMGRLTSVGIEVEAGTTPIANGGYINSQRYKYGYQNQ